MKKRKKKSQYGYIAHLKAVNFSKKKKPTKTKIFSITFIMDVKLLIFAFKFFKANYHCQIFSILNH